jgi:hypothetical protein
MKIPLATLLIIALSTSAALNAEDIKTTTGQEYKDATISRAEPDGLVIIYSAGIVKIPFTELSADLREKYHYDPQAAAAYQKQSDEAAQKWAQSVAEAKERARLLNPPAVVAATASPPPRRPHDEPSLATVEPTDNLNTIPNYTPQQFQATKLNLVGRIIRVTFVVRDANPEESADGETYSGWLGDASGHNVTVRFPASRLPWFINITADYYRTKALVPVAVYGRVVKDRSRGIVFDLIGTEISTDFYGPHIIWR